MKLATEPEVHSAARHVPFDEGGAIVFCEGARVGGVRWVVRVANWRVRCLRRRGRSRGFRSLIRGGR